MMIKEFILSTTTALFLIASSGAEAQESTTKRIVLEENQRLEFAVGTVIEDKRDQLFGQYFPQVGPIAAEYGGRGVLSFAILESKGAEGAKFGGMFIWPSSEAFDDLHDDERFKNIRHLRDDSMSLLSNGHFFRTEDDTIEIASIEYGVVIAKSLSKKFNPLLELNLAGDSPEQKFIGQTLFLVPWTASLYDIDSELVAKVKFN